MFTCLVTHVERGQKLVAALPPSPLLSGADRDGIVRHSAWRWDGYLVYIFDSEHTHSSYCF